MITLPEEGKIETVKPNQVYFYRNRGPWDWNVNFELKSWRDLWRSEAPFLSKISLSALILAQDFTGSLQMWTKVDFQESVSVVHHSTRMKKWGLTIYRSEKDFILEEDGYGIQLEGVEYYWPLGFLAIPFKSQRGIVDVSTTRASYQMPMAGIACDCQAILELPNGQIKISTPWFNGSFMLTEDSNNRLAKRFK